MKPMIHITAQRGWLNDPNGLIYYQGAYHVFHQLFPYNTEWSTMHWGHLISHDLLHWEHRPLALYPSKMGDRNGCFSGSAIQREGELLLFYTGVQYHELLPENIHVLEGRDFTACQMMQTSPDGQCFDNLRDKRMIIPPIEDAAVGSRANTRDPKVWKMGDWYYMLLGSQCALGDVLLPALLLYRSRDAHNWAYCSRTTGQDWGWMWECPDYFSVDGLGVLCVSVMRHEADEPGAYTNHVYAGLAGFDEDAGRIHFDRKGFRRIDPGGDFYAPQSMVDEVGRRIQFGWVRMPQPQPGADWRGMLTLPRLVCRRGERVCFDIHPFVAAAFTRPTQRPCLEQQGPWRLQADLPAGAVLELGGYFVRRQVGHLELDRSRVYPESQMGTVSCTIPAPEAASHVDIVVDHGIVELYINGGEHTLAQAVYGMSSAFSARGAEGLAIHHMEDERISSGKKP